MSKPDTPEGMALLERRKIEAEILKEVYETLKASHGEEVARRTLLETTRRAATAFARRVAETTPGGTSLQTFQELIPRWAQGEAVEIEVTEQTARTYKFNVVRCRYAETFHAMGLGDIGHLLTCNRDLAFCESYDPRLKLERTQTIMQGASHCDFKYRYED